MDKISGMFGGDKAAATETVKGPSATLRDAGIDPSNLKFSLNQDGSIDVSGPVASQSECDQICEALKKIPNVSGVQNKMVVGAPAPVPEPEPVPEPAPEAVAPVEEASETEADSTQRTYTVESGDTLWAISKAMYGSGGKYMKIFEANTDILEDPDKIRPGQKLVIPDLES
jgi:LysM repeat protein